MSPGLAVTTPEAIPQRRSLVLPAVEASAPHIGMIMTQGALHIRAVRTVSTELYELEAL
jgi:hypothetical protein